MQTLFEDAEVIAAYTRQDAIEDGVLVPLERLTDDAQILGMYKFPICLTAAVHELIVLDLKMNPHKDINGILWDIVYMSQRCIVKKLDESTMLFNVWVNGKELTLKIQCHPDDDMSPCMTIMGKHEN